MQKAIFFEEAYNKGLLPQILEGYIFSLSIPDIEDIEKKSNPFLLQMISYSGLKSVEPMSDGVRFQAQGSDMFCMLEPANYSQKHVEPASRSQSTTAFMPYRFSECEIFFTKDTKYRVLMAKESHQLYDSFIVDFPDKGDICVIYYVFDKDNMEKTVIPFIQENITFILKTHLRLRDVDSKNISKKFMEVVKQFHMPKL